MNEYAGINKQTKTGFGKKNVFVQKQKFTSLSSLKHLCTIQRWLYTNVVVVFLFITKMLPLIILRRFFSSAFKLVH